jgi:hypothetical protein
VVRLDSKKTHGWQLRYGSWKLFSDYTNDGSGAAKSLELAAEELAKRIAKLPAPTRLRTDAMIGKANDLPVGISGPIERRRPGRNVVQYYLQVTFPVAGRKPVNTGVYIATENTLCKEKFNLALAKAIAVRDSAVRKFKLSATKSKRESAVAAGLLRAK